MSSNAIPPIDLDRENMIYYLRQGSKGSGEGGEMDKPEDIAINPKNKNVYVTDTKNSRIIEFTLLKQY